MVYYSFNARITHSQLKDAQSADICHAMPLRVSLLRIHNFFIGVKVLVGRPASSHQAPIVLGIPAPKLTLHWNAKRTSPSCPCPCSCV